MMLCWLMYLTGYGAATNIYQEEIAYHLRRFPDADYCRGMTDIFWSMHCYYDREMDRATTAPKYRGELHELHMMRSQMTTGYNDWAYLRFVHDAADGRDGLGMGTERQWNRLQAFRERLGEESFHKGDMPYPERGPKP